MEQESPSVHEATAWIRKELMNHYPDREIQGFTDLIFDHLLDYSKTDILLNRDTKLSKSTFFQIKEILNQLLGRKPMQYILGKAWFYGLKLSVSPDVLIPRQETEELVKWIIDDAGSNSLKVLDIGTGSGCIAVALAKNLHAAEVTATDISEKALMVAGQNARSAGTEIEFFTDDIFAPVRIMSGKFDIIVSNPPYVTESEKALVDKNVLHFEPLTALFVPDENALIYYKAITSLARVILNPGGRLYFEINENKAGETEELLIRNMFSGIEIRKDINGKFRMIKAVRN